jgi:hypothetical protein
MRKNILNYLYIVLFFTALILTIVAFAHSLRPINAIISSQKRMSSVLPTPEQVANLLTETKPYRKLAFIFSCMYIPALLFFAYMLSRSVLSVLNIKIPKIVTPIVAGVNTVLYFIVLVMVNNVGGGLGLAGGLETTANYYSWYTAPVFGSGSNIYNFAPTFFTIIIPLLFLGILPLISGLKRLFHDKN